MRTFAMILVTLVISGCRSLPMLSHHDSKNITQGTVEFTSWLAQSQTLKIPAEGLTLGESIQRAEAAFHGIYNGAFLHAMSLDTPAAQRLIDKLHGEGSPDVVVLIRNDVWHLFPRELCVDRKVADVPLRDHDVVMTIPFEISLVLLQEKFIKPDGTLDNTATPLEPKRFLITGPLVASTIRTSEVGQVFQELERSSLLHPDEGQFSPISTIILRRQTGGKNFHFYFPYRYSIELGGHPYDTDRRKDRDLIWSKYKDGVFVREGDVFECTRLESVLSALNGQ